MSITIVLKCFVNQSQSWFCFKLGNVGTYLPHSRTGAAGARIVCGKGRFFQGAGLFWLEKKQSTKPTKSHRNSYFLLKCQSNFNFSWIYEKSFCFRYAIEESDGRARFKHSVDRSHHRHVGEVEAKYFPHTKFKNGKF